MKKIRTALFILSSTWFSLSANQNSDQDFFAPTLCSDAQSVCAGYINGDCGNSCPYKRNKDDSKKQKEDRKEKKRRDKEKRKKH